jgi:hypothetical protein
MRLRNLVLTAILASTALVGCARNDHTVTTAEKKLTVSGARDGVERFAKLQQSRTPALAVSAIAPLGAGRAEAEVMLPVSFTGKDLVHTTREALAAGLDYKFEARRSDVKIRT